MRMEILDYEALKELFIEKNREFTKAVREKKSYNDLRLLFEELKGLNERLEKKRSLQPEEVSY